MLNEHNEAHAATLADLLGRELVNRLRSGDATASDMKVALDYIKHHGVTDNPGRPGSPVNEVEAALARLPFPSPSDSVTEELKNG